MATVEVEFFKYPKVKYSTKQPPLDKGTKTQCFLKEETSVLNPVLQIRGASTTFGGSEFPDFNLAYIADFHRYYFVRNITSVSALIWEVALEVDPLSTYKTEIINAEAFIQYAASGYDLSVSDSRILKKPQSTVTITEQGLEGFNEKGSFILNIFNGVADDESQFTLPYVFSNSGMAELANALNNSTLWEEVLKQFSDPMQAIASSVWLPIEPNTLTHGTAEVKLGYNTVLGAGRVAKKYVEKEYEMVVPITTKEPYGYEEFRTYEPYSELYMILPGVGMESLPLTRIRRTAVGQPKITVKYRLDCMTGDIAYKIYSGADIIHIAMGSIGAAIPISAISNGNILNATSSVIGALTSAVSTYIAGGTQAATSAISHGIGYGAQQAISAINNTTYNTTAKGSTGSKAGTLLNDAIRIIYVRHQTVEEPLNLKNVVGLPVYRKGVIGNFGKFVQCIGAQVESWASAEEADAINSYLKGGILIE